MCPERTEPLPEPPARAVPPAAAYRGRMSRTSRIGRIGGRVVAWEDYGGAGRPLLALHGTFGRGAVFAGVARQLEGRVRVIAPDLRGHGHSDAADDYGAAAFVEDAAAFVRHLGLGPLPVLGHSRGGIVAYQ